MCELCVKETDSSFLEPLWRNIPHLPNPNSLWSTFYMFFKSSDSIENARCSRRDSQTQTISKVHSFLSVAVTKLLSHGSCRMPQVSPVNQLRTSKLRKSLQSTRCVHAWDEIDWPKS